MNPYANLQMPDIAGGTQNALMRGIQFGTAMRERKQAEESKKAEDDFYRAKIGGDPNQISTAQNALATYNPKAVYEMQTGEQRTGVIRRAAQGDPVAKLEMWGVDPDMAMKLDKFQVEKAAEGFDFIADAAFQIVKLPPEQRPQAWEQYIQQGAAMGFDGLSQYSGKYSEQNLNSIVSKAGQMKEFQEFQQPKYSPVGENGMQGFQYGVPMANGAIAPQAVAPPPKGFVLDNGGPTQPASGNF